MTHQYIQRWATLLAATLLAVLTVAGAARAASSPPLPLSPAYLNATGAYLQVEPARITYTGDGTGVLGGASARTGSSAIHWTSWTAARAKGTGYNQLNDCRPDCAGGTFHLFRVRIELWRPRRIAGRLVFTRLTIVYTGRRPGGEPRHYTFTDVYRRGGGFSWGPPGAEGYCVHTYGLRPAAGCRNIHALP